MNPKWDTRINRERALIFKALGHPLRLAIIDELKTRECCVHELETALGAEQSNLSKHLALLKQTGIIDSRKEGLFVFYSLVIPCVNSFFSCVNQVLTKKLEADRELSQIL